MKTVFKEGMKVYDQLNFSDKGGIVVEVCNDEEDEYPIGVSFENETGRNYYTPEGRFRKDNIPTLSTNPYKVILEGFEQKAPIPTYEDIVKERNYIYLPENLVAPNKELADAVVALLKLLFLRDYYNEGWQPKNSSYVYIITTRNRELVKDCLMGDFRVLYFRSQEISNRFFEEQKELLKIAKPLL